MSRSLRSFCFVVLFAFSFQITAKSQQVFVDSIRNMIADLDSNIQYAPINEVLKQSLSFCTGTTMNDSLRIALKTLISENYILISGLRQAVSPHLIDKYTVFYRRIAQYIAETESSVKAENALRIACILIRGGLYDEARNILVKAGVDQYVLNYYLGRTYTNAYKPDSSYILYSRSLRQNPQQTTEQNILYANTLFLLANFCYSHNKRDSAIQLYQQQLNLRKKIDGENSSEYAYWMIVTADMFNYMTKYRLALDMSFKAIEITSATIGKRSWLYALCLGVTGEIYYRTGEYDKALPFTQQSLELKRELFGNGYFDNVVSLHNLATLYIQTGLYDQAIPLLEESLAIAKKYYGEQLVYAVEIHPLAEAYEYKGEYDRSLPLYQRSIGIHQRLNRLDAGGVASIFYPRVLHSIACLYTKLGQFDKAIEYFKQALAMKKIVTTEMSPEYTRTLNAYAEACLLKGDYGKALNLQLRSLSVARKIFGKVHPDVAAGLYNLSILYYQQKNFSKAEIVCKQAMKMQTEIYGNIHPNLAMSLDMLGNIKNQQKQGKDAAVYFKNSYTIRRKIFPVIHPAHIASLYNLGISYVQKGNMPEAEQFLMRADSAALLHIQQSYITLSEEEKLIYLRNTEKQFQYLPSLLYLKKTTNPEIVNRVYSDALALKSMVMFHQQQVYSDVRSGNDSITLDLYNQWRFNKGVLGKQLLLSSGKYFAGFDSLYAVTTQMEASLSRISASFKTNRWHFLTDPSQVEGKLGSNTAAIEFICFRLFDGHWRDSIIYAAVLMLPGKHHAVFIPLCEERNLKRLLRFSNNGGAASVNYLYPQSGIETAVSRELYKAVWQPLEPFLKGVRTVYFSPAGLLLRLSFAAIHTGNGKMLSDIYDLKQMVCTRNVVNAEIAMSFKDAALWGGIDYGAAVGSAKKNSLERLPGARSEITAVFSMLQENGIQCRQQSEHTATETLFKEMDGNSPELLHIATHGFFLRRSAQSKEANMVNQNNFSLQPNPMLRTGLLLSGSNDAWSGKNASADLEDGVLTAYEISQLDLANTKLVTLSACQTALGEIEDYEGVFGLQRAFKMAGVKHVLMSLWAVPDKETEELMLLFYNSLLKSNDVNAALRSAQIQMKKRYAPYYWAGFVVTE